MAAGARRRRRLLPTWMGAAGDERAAAAPPRVGRRRGPAVTGPRAAAVYCMNEAELVDVSLSVLAKNQQREAREEKARPGSEEEEELQPSPDEATGSAASTEGGSGHRPALPSPPDAGATAERTGRGDSEDDVLKYVREIFFS
ncbi:cell cycle regulator of non-homologous end joining [Pterocles gutturalis]